MDGTPAPRATGAGGTTSTSTLPQVHQVRIQDQGSGLPRPCHIGRRHGHGRAESTRGAGHAASQVGRAMHTFLVLVGYFKRFIHDYYSIAAPLTRLLRKEGFRWCGKAEAIFGHFSVP
jgi:hypothetical protein